jgi:IclR family KDG regulon transcriptional repressor
MSVKSADRVMQILELLSNHPEGLTVKEISQALSYPQSSAFNLVQSLSQNDFLSQTRIKQYKLGPKLIQIGMRSLESLDIYSEGLPYLTALMEKVNETVFMAVLSGDEMVYVSKVSSNRSIQTSAQIGSRKPMYCTGLGKAFLACLPLKERKRILDNIELKAMTPKTIIKTEELERQLDLFVEQGYAIDDEEGEEGLFCLAAPVFDAYRKIIAAISVAGPKERMIVQKDYIVEQLLNTAGKISESIGYTKT